MKWKHARHGVGSVVLGMLLSVTGASGEKADRPFHIACTAAERVDTHLASAICADFVATIQAKPDLAIQPLQRAPLAVGPGLEITIERATATNLEITPTWVDAEGRRLSQPSVGIRIMDAEMSKAQRHNFFRRLIADSPI